MTTWRELLGMVINNSKERQRLANILGISAITLNRWVSGASKPHPHNLHKLLEALPQAHGSSLLPLLSEEFPDFTPEQVKNERSSQGEISSSFYAHFLKEYAVTSPILRYWTLCPLILHHALKQLDPDQQGMALAVVHFVKPVKGQKVRTLYIHAGLATTPWPRQLELHSFFLAGAESLAGYAISTDHPVIVQSCADQGPLPVHWVDMEESVAAYPLLLSDRVAGCLTCSSTRAEHFTPERQTLLQQYAKLLILTCDDFYAMEDLDLQFMPDYRTQLDYLSNFQQRVLNEIGHAIRMQQPLALREAQQVVRQQVEEELLMGNLHR